MTQSTFADAPRPCPACEDTASLPVGHKHGFELLRCQGCRTLYTAHLPSLDKAQDYDDYYGDYNLSVPAFIAVRIKEILAGFDAYRSSNRLLDVGFGAGTLLQAAAGQGWDAQGVEVSRPAYEHVRDLGFRVFLGELAQAQYPNNHFDVVVASEILEHLPQPRLFLQEVARILRPGGLFWATTPHGRGLSYRLIGLKWSVVSPPEHLQVFSTTGLRRLLGQAGLRNVSLRTHGFNPLEILNALRPHPLAVAQCVRTDGKGHQPPLDKTFDRVETSYKLNSLLTQGPARRVFKNLLNGALNVCKIGDSVKIEASL